MNIKDSYLLHFSKV